MTHHSSYHNAYKAASYREESKTRQVVMLYEGVIRYVRQAREAIEQNDIETRYNTLAKACDIITGLQLSLNFDEGGAVARLLYDYYSGLDARLSSLHFTQDIAVCDLCLKHLAMMKEAWEEVDEKTQRNAPEAPAGRDAVEIRGALESILAAENDMAQSVVASGVHVDMQSLNLSA